MSQVCQKCGMPVTPGFKFCNSCGAPVEEDVEVSTEAVPYSKWQGYQGRALHILTGAHGGEFVNVYPECSIGRKEANLLIEDKTISPVHAKISVNEDETLIEDLGSLNGVFLRIKEKMTLQDGDLIRAGVHYFLYEVFSQETVDDNYGADFFASPGNKEKARLIEVLSGGRRGRARVIPDSGITVGRSEGEFLCFDDEKMSLKHFSIRYTQRSCILLDYSANGTYLQIRQPVKLTGGDLFFIGETLFRVI